MGTLLKYEFRRSRTIFLGIIGVTLLIELLYLIGWCFEINILLAIGLIGGFSLHRLRRNGHPTLWSYHVQR